MPPPPPRPEHTPWQGHRTGLEMILGGKFLSGEGFLMEVATVPKLESDRVWQQVAVCWCLWLEGADHELRGHRVAVSGASLGLA